MSSYAGIVAVEEQLEIPSKAVPAACERKLASAVRSAHLGRRTVPRDFDLDFGGLLIAARRHALAWCLSPGKSWAKTPLDT